MKKLLIVLISTLFLVGCEGIFDNTNIDPVEKPIVCNEGYELNTVTNICEEIDENIIDYEIGIEDNDTFYQLLVYAFNDSNGDGVGDFKGIAEKVDYFKYLGIEVIWLSPIHPASSYHHYDVEDYFDVDALYEVDGFTFEDMMEVLNENGIDVILDMVVNHSSNEHPYFIEAVNAFSTGVASEYTDYYILSESSFTHPLLGYNSAYTNGVYYDAFFGVSSMPAFDFDYQPVRDMWIDIFSYWLDKGVAGFRLDAAKHVYDDVELNNEVFNYFVDELALEYEDVYFVNEAWGGEEEIIAYYGSSMNNLNFTLKDKIDLALLGDRTFGTFLQTFQEAIRLENPNAIEANFISNHDIGRLGYGLSIEEQKLIAALNILIPGNSYIFYGDETSLVGDYELQSGYAGWEDSRYRTPMLWDDNTGVFADYISDVTASVADAYTTSTTTVEAAMADSDSLLNTYKKLIDIKSNLPIFSTGSISSVVLDENLISYQITEGDENILVIHNLDSVEYTVNSDHMTSIIDYVTQTTNPVIDGDNLIVPALSSIVIELDDTILVEHNEEISSVFIRGSFTGWDTDANFSMDELDGVYTFELILDEDSIFKIFQEGTWYGYDYVVPGEVEIQTEEAYNNIIIMAGSYLITFSNGQIIIEYLD